MQHPSDSNLFSKGRVYGAWETGEAFSGTEDRQCGAVGKRGSRCNRFECSSRETSFSIREIVEKRTFHDLFGERRFARGFKLLPGQSFLLAMFAPARIALNFSQATVGWTSVL
jgi:hypothetical protein